MGTQIRVDLTREEHHRWSESVDLADVTLVQLREMRRALQAALDDVTEAMRPKLLEYASDGYSQQRMAELSGYSIQAVRRIVVPGAYEKNKAYAARAPQVGREVLGPKPARGKDAGKRVARGKRDIFDAA